MKSSKETGKLNKKSKVKDTIQNVTGENKAGFSHEEIRETTNEICLQRIERGEDGTYSWQIQKAKIQSPI